MDSELIKQLHDHDIRLTRVETELQGVHREIKEQRVDIRNNAEIAQEIQKDVRSIVAKLSDLSGSQRILIWGLGAFGFVLGGLELWAVFA